MDWSSLTGREGCQCMCPSRVIFDVASLCNFISLQSASLPENCCKWFLKLKYFFQWKCPSPQSVLHIIALRITCPSCFSSVLHFTTELAVENIQNTNLFKHQRSWLIPRSNKGQKICKSYLTEWFWGVKVK